MKKYYVILTGAYNNAGDYLIGHRAKKILEFCRPDRDIIEISRKEIIEKSVLEICNNAQAILITGGPAINQNIYPNIVKLNLDLVKIKAPISFFGVGWRGESDNWGTCLDFNFSKQSLSLIDKMKTDGLNSSVRDLQSKYILSKFGLNNVLITGCPALFQDNAIIPTDIVYPSNSPNIGFSIGVSYFSKEESFHETIFIAQRLKRQFPNSKLSGIFHHSFDLETLKRVYGPTGIHIRNHDLTMKLIQKLSELEFENIDASGSYEKMVDVYNKLDCHIGFRVHGHVYMTSIGKPSVLLAEDTRALGFKELIGGAIINNLKVEPKQSLNKILKLKLKKILKKDAPKTKFPEAQIAINMLNDEVEKRTFLTKNALDSIRNVSPVMFSYLKSLP